MATVFLGIGSNINAEENMQKAAALLRSSWPNIRFSSVYETAPREVEDQPVFLNAVTMFSTDDTVETVHQKTLVIEAQLQKAPPFRFGPRTIDIDILLYDELTMKRDELTIPHPRMLERRFVLEPMSELTELSAEQKAALTKTTAQDCTRTNVRL